MVAVLLSNGSLRGCFCLGFTMLPQRLPPGEASGRLLRHDRLNEHNEGQGSDSAYRKRQWRPAECGKQDRDCRHSSGGGYYIPAAFFASTVGGRPVAVPRSHGASPVRGCIGSRADERGTVAVTIVGRPGEEGATSAVFNDLGADVLEAEVFEVEVQPVIRGRGVEPQPLAAILLDTARGPVEHGRAEPDAGRGTAHRHPMDVESVGNVVFVAPVVSVGDLVEGDGGDDLGLLLDDEHSLGGDVSLKVQSLPLAVALPLVEPERFQPAYRFVEQIVYLLEVTEVSRPDSVCAEILPPSLRPACVFFFEIPDVWITVRLKRLLYGRQRAGTILEDDRPSGRPVDGCGRLCKGYRDVGMRLISSKGSSVGNTHLLLKGTDPLLCPRTTDHCVSPLDRAPRPRPRCVHGHPAREIHP